jgi:Asp-tRNA(Asn)/Glu-tRNA(Gln) amidotransferase A subunit family amidase
MSTLVIALLMTSVIALLAGCNTPPPDVTPAATSATTLVVEETAAVEEFAVDPTEEAVVAEEVVVEAATAEPTPDESTATDAEATGETATAVEEIPELRMPRYVQSAYAAGSRSMDGNPGPAYWQNHAVHNIDITVSPPNRTVTATQQITYTNNSPNPMPFALVRLYQDVRRVDATQEDPLTEEFFNSGLQISSATMNGTPLDMNLFSSLLPFKTVRLVQLPQPLMPGQSANFTFDWTYDLALEAKKEGVVDPTTFFIAYFFPRISVMSDADTGLPGLVPGGDVEEFTYRSGRELNNDFADFTYSVTVPKNFIVWATGDLQNPDEVLQPDRVARLQESFTSDEIINIATPEELQQGLVTAQTDTVTWRWKADNVPDVAIGLSDRYIWDAGSVLVDESTGRRTAVQSAYAPEHTYFQTMVQDGKDAVAFTSTEWPGIPYPYDKMSIFVGGADEEYPGMANDEPEPSEVAPGVVGTPRFIAMHEIAHGYFPFYMGIDERRYPFMDEGWTTAFEYLFNVQDTGQEAADALFNGVRGGLSSPYPGEEIPIIAAADATRGQATGNIAYDKPALAYLALKELMGDEAFKAALHEFMARWNGKRPLPWDMFNTFNDVSDENLNWFFHNWFFEGYYIDLAVREVNAVDGGYEIVVGNPGGLAAPFDVKVVYADGTEESFRQGPGVWKGSIEQATVPLETDRELKSVTLEGGIFQDSSPNDNTWEAPVTAESEPTAPANAVSEVDIMSSNYAALAASGLATAGAALAECPTRTFPVPDPGPDWTARRPMDFAPFAEALAGFTPEMATMMDGRLTGATLPEMQAMLDNGDFTSEQMVLYYLNRIQRYDVNLLNSVMELNPEALEIAQALDAERAAGTRRGNLHGIPLLIKDNIAAAAPLHTTAGAFALNDWQAGRDAFLVTNLRDAGAVLLGKANLSEWANYTDPCMPNGFSALGGQVRHAWGPYDPLGSSTGSAVAVAANLVPVTVGSETSGSLTAPSRTNGVVGLRPSQGVISGDYIIPLESNLDTAGPIGHSVTDVAVLLTAMAGTDANDPATARAAALDGTDFTQFLSLDEARKVRVGVVQFDVMIGNFFAAAGMSHEDQDALTPEDWQSASDALVAPGVGGGTQATIDALTSQGIEVVVIKESELPPYVPNGEAGLLNYGFQNSVNAFLARLGEDAPLDSLTEAVAIANEFPANRAPYGQRYVEWSVNTETTAEQYEAAVREGEQYYTDWMQWFKDTHNVDVILMGVYYQNAGLAHIPALTVPTGRNVDPQTGEPRDPSGVLITGPYLSDGQVLAVGYALEQALGIDQQPDLDATIEQIGAVNQQ